MLYHTVILSILIIVNILLGAMWQEWTSWSCSGCGNNIIPNRTRICNYGYDCEPQIQKKNETCEAIDKCTGRYSWTFRQYKLNQ